MTDNQTRSGDALQDSVRATGKGAERRRIVSSGMRAAVTTGRSAMELLERPEPGRPGDGEVVVRPEAVGLCGSDFHYFHGDVGAVEPAQLYPRVQGHEQAFPVDGLDARLAAF